ncbi:hypothetical protein HZS_1429 [Henneguya salminicola]|nr:hypothetical protein HZS_1429 [Henneguya salminicola]
MSGDILKLPQNVIDKISAGEVIQRPFNAIKELIENSIDAGSKSISIIAKEAGLKYIKIIDDGNGIKKEDFALLCHRYATSKIHNFEDLCGVTSYGFRGEALASISNIAIISVISRHKHSELAFSARYINGAMVGLDSSTINEPHVCGGNYGSQITVENMFYTNPIRKSTFTNIREEYGKICSVVGRYAIHFSDSISFTCKRDIDSLPDICTRGRDSKISVIQSMYKYKSDETLRNFTDFNKDLHVNIQGVASLSSFTTKKYMFILFINNRLVDCNSLKSAVASVYSSVLRRHQNPFFYISIEIDPLKVDVNVHPTKQEIIFVNQTAIISYIEEFLRNLIHQESEGVSLHIENQQSIMDSFSKKTAERTELTIQPKDDKTPPNRLIRTDYREQTLDCFVQNKSVLSISLDESKENSELVSSQEVCVISVSKQPRVLHLSSVRELKESIQQCKCEELTKIFQKFTYVGPLGTSKILLQYDVNLYLIDCFHLFSNLFYQIIINNFGSFNYWKLSLPYNFTSIFSENHQEQLDEFLFKQPMLMDYFSIQISEEGQLTHLPQLIKKFRLNPQFIPSFVKKLALETNWVEEKTCFQDVSKAIAWLYASSLVHYNIEENSSALRKFHQNDLLPLIRAVFIPQKSMSYNGTIFSNHYLLYVLMNFIIL